MLVGCQVKSSNGGLVDQPRTLVEKKTVIGHEVVLEPVTSLDLSQTKERVRIFLPFDTEITKHPVSIYQLHFSIKLQDGEFSPVIAKVFVPLEIDSELPVVIYGHGTTGLADRCAPTREDPTKPTLGNYENQMIAMASTGMVVVMPNYEGLDNPERIHYYFNKDIEARTLLGAARALETVRDQLPKSIEGVFLGGYSQGGHAAFSAVDLVHTISPEVQINGVFAHGATTNLRNLLLHNPNLAPYLVHAYSKKNPDFEVSTLIKPDEVYSVERAQQLCVDEAFQYDSTTPQDTYTATFLMALEANTLQSSFPEIHRYFEQNSAGTSYTMIPTLILQDPADPVVTLDDQQQFVEQLCDRKVPVELKTYEDVHHFWTREESFNDTVAWIFSISASSENARSSCIPQN